MSNINGSQTDVRTLRQQSLDYLEYLKSDRRLAIRSIEAYSQDLREFVRYLESHAADLAVSSDVIVSYRQHLLGARGAAPATAKRRLASLRTFFRWLVRGGVLASSPFDGSELGVRIPKRLPRCLDSGEVSALVGHRGTSESRLAIAMLVSTGMRVGELSSLRLSCIDTLLGSVRILGKGDRERTVFVTDAGLLAELVRRSDQDLPGDPPLIRGRSGKAMSTASIRRLVRVSGQRSGLNRRITPHMLRHTAATLLMERGVDVRIVQRLLGHRSILTTQLYLHVSDVTLRMAVARAGVLASLNQGGAP